MLEIHEREHKLNRKLKGKSQDTINAVANEFSQDLMVLTIDEF
jgi:predicted ATPase